MQISDPLSVALSKVRCMKNKSLFMVVDLCEVVANFWESYNVLYCAKAIMCHTHFDVKFEPYLQCKNITIC